MKFVLFLLAIVVLTIECMEFHSTCDSKPVIKPINIFIIIIILLHCEVHKGSWATFDFENR